MILPIIYHLFHFKFVYGKHSPLKIIFVMEFDNAKTNGITKIYSINGYDLFQGAYIDAVCMYIVLFVNAANLHLQIAELPHCFALFICRDTHKRP